MVFAGDLLNSLRTSMQSSSTISVSCVVDFGKMQMNFCSLCIIYIRAFTFKIACVAWHAVLRWQYGKGWKKYVERQTESEEDASSAAGRVRVHPGLHPTFSGSIFKYKQCRPLVYKPGPSPTEGKERVDLTLRGNVLLVVGGRVHRSIISRETGSQRDRERSTCT